MAGTLMLDRLIGRARAAGSVVRLLGDDQQLAAVEAGGVLRHLDHEVGAVGWARSCGLSTPRRPTQPSRCATASLQRQTSTSAAAA